MVGATLKVAANVATAIALPDLMDDPLKEDASALPSIRCFVLRISGYPTASLRWPSTGSTPRTTYWPPVHPLAHLTVLRQVDEAPHARIHKAFQLGACSGL